VDWGSLAEKVAAPALTAVGGWIGAALRFNARITSVEKSLESLVKTLSAQEVSVTLKVSTLLTALSDRVARVEKDVQDLKSEYNELEDSSHDLAKHTELARFMEQDMRRQEENQRKWLEINRALGEIKGLMKALKLT